MKYNQLGRTGLFVSEICLGAMTFGGGVDAGIWKAIGSIGQDGVDKIIGHALAAGVNFIDTADVYSFGQSERVVGQSLKNLGVARKDVVVATKVYGEMGPGPNDRGASRGHIMDSVRGSLERLQTDYIDLYQIHGNDSVTPIDETLRAMDDLVKQGKVRFIGHSNFDGAMTNAAAKVSSTAKISAFISAQNHYSLLTRDIEKDLVAACEANGVGILPYFPLESGMLTGKYKRGEKPAEGTRLATWAARMPGATERFMNDAAFAKVEKLQALADKSGTTLLSMAFGWLLNKPYIGSVIAGATKPEQVESNVKAAAWRPTPGINAEIEKITAG